MSNATSPITSRAPRQILRNGEAIDDGWRYIDAAQPLPAEGDIFVSLDRFLADPPAFAARLGRTGVVFEPGHCGRELEGHHDALGAIAIRFPKFADGRGYTIARRLREQLGWTGQLRAVGDVLPDQVMYMQRCGFDAIELRADKSLETARAALATFSVHYQAAADDPRPLYRRRAVTRAAARAS